MSHADFPSSAGMVMPLFFAASTNYGLNAGWLDMTSYERDGQQFVCGGALKQNTSLGAGK